VRFVALGDVMVDVVADRLPASGERVHGSVRVRAGGSAVNAALVARAVRADTQIVGRVGTDWGGDLVPATLEQSGIDVHLARDDELPTGVAVALSDAVVAERARMPASRPTTSRRRCGEMPPRFRFRPVSEGSAEAAQTALRQFEGPWTAVDLVSPRLARRDFSARVVFATRHEAAAVPGLSERFEIVCMKDDYGVARTSPFGAGDAFAAAFLVAIAGGAGVDDARMHARDAAARAAAG
jgi:hypothetical protein